MNKDEIKNVIIFDGVKEFSKNEILEDTELTAMMNAVINLGGFASFAEKINSEEGLIYITTELDHKFGAGKLKNVSNKLYFEYSDKNL